jgi:hypothetical protein
MPDLPPTLLKVLNVVNIEVRQDHLDPRVKSVLFRELSISLGGDCKTIRKIDTLRAQFPTHLAQRSVRATDKRNIVNADLFQTAV